MFEVCTNLLIDSDSPTKMVKLTRMHWVDSLIEREIENGSVFEIQLHLGCLSNLRFSRWNAVVNTKTVFIGYSI